ncbi:MAG: hypothetical protein WBG37_12510 [Desulfobacterales bacterium]
MGTQTLRRIFYSSLWVTIALLSGCSLVVSDHAPLLVESESARLTHCDYLTTVSKVIQQESLLGIQSRFEARQAVMTRAVRLGATHLVWLHSSKDGAMALIYRCPPLGAPTPSATDLAAPIATLPESASTDIPIDNPPPSREYSRD